MPKNFFFSGDFFFVQGRSAKVLVYNGENGKNGSAFHLQKPDENNNFKIYAAYRYENSICFLPQSMDEKILYFDMISQTYFEKRFFDLSIREKIGYCGKQELHIGYSCFYEGAIWFVLDGTAWYAKYDLTDEKITLFKAGNKNVALSAICFDGKNIWLTQKNSSHVICVGKKIVDIPGAQSYTWIYHIDGWIIIPSGFTNKLVLIHKNTLEASLMDLPDKKTEGRGRGRGNDIANCCAGKEHVFLIQHGFRELFVLDKKTLQIKSMNLQCENYLEKCFDEKQPVLAEEEDIYLEHLLRFFTENTECVNGHKSEASIGNHVWKNAKSGSTQTK